MASDSITATNAAQQPFMPVIRELVRAYHAFTSYDARALREIGLTVPQADVLFTLGNTEGMSCRELGERTLITKGTLTGVLDRMEGKKLLRRIRSTTDRRSVRIELTDAGAALFESAFPAHVRRLAARFEPLGERQMRDTAEALARLKTLF